MREVDWGQVIDHHGCPQSKFGLSLLNNGEPLMVLEPRSVTKQSCVLG